MPAKIHEIGCTECLKCIDICPVNAISIKDKIEVDENKCLSCGMCMRYCEERVIEMIK